MHLQHTLYVRPEDELTSLKRFFNLYRFLQRARWSALADWNAIKNWNAIKDLYTYTDSKGTTYKETYTHVDSNGTRYILVFPTWKQVIFSCITKDNVTNEWLLEYSEEWAYTDIQNIPTLTEEEFVCEFNEFIFDYSEPD